MTAQKRLFRVKSGSKKESSKWLIVGYPHGKRERYYFSTEKEAKKAAADRNREITSFGTQIVLPNDLRVEAVESAKRLQPYGKTIRDAVNFFLAHLKILNSSVTVKEFTLAVRNEFKRRLRAKEISARHEQTMLEALAKFEKQFGDRLVKAIAGSEIKIWLAGTPLATKTRNKVLGYIRGAFSTGKELGLVDTHPLDGITGFTKSGKTAKSPRPLSADEMVKLINAADQRIKPFILIGGFAGLRNEERINLDWSHIRVGEKIIDLSAKISKTGRRRLVPISDNLAEWLALYAKESGPVIYKSRYTAYDDFRKATLAAGFKEWPENSLRDSFCSYRYEQTDDAAKTAKEAGHSVDMLMRNYQKLVTKTETTKFWSISPDRKGVAKILQATQS